MAIDRIDHFQLVVSDVDKALDFYNRLGLTTKQMDPLPEGAPRRAYLKVGDGQEINVMTPEAVAAQRHRGDGVIEPGRRHQRSPREKPASPATGSGRVVPAMARSMVRIRASRSSAEP